MKLKLYGYWRSSASWRVRWALELKKIPYDYIPVNILKGEQRGAEHLARVPMGTLPVLEIEPHNFLSQSLVILLWIEENFDDGPFVFGKDRSDRYIILELCELINSDTAPLQTPRVQNAHSDEPAKKADFAKHFIELGLRAFEKKIEGSAAIFSVGNSVTAADLFLIPQLYNAKRFGFDLAKDYPKLHKIYESCLKTEACLRASPEKQIDAMVAP